MATPNGDDDQVYVAILILLCGIVVIGLLGPIGLLVAGATIMIGAIAGLGHAGGAVVTLVGAGMGVVLVDPTDWLMGPMKDMAEIYRVYLFDGWTWDTDGLWTYYGKLLAHGPAWSYFSPLGVFAGGITITAWQLYWSSPLRRTARGKPPKAERPSWRAWWTTRSMPTISAAIESGTFMGIDNMTGRHVEISDADANTHSLVLGTPGSGKTVSVLNLVESAIHRKLPVVYIDGKGDYGLARTITAYARAQGRPAYLFAMRGESCRYNPLVAGDYSAKKDRIIELRDWSEDHYRKLAEGYLQTVFKVLAACKIETDLITLANFMSVKALSTLIRERTDQIGDEAKSLALEVNEQQAAEPQDLFSGNQPSAAERNEAFLTTGADGDAYLQQSLQKPISPYEIKAGSIIPAALITGLNSDLPGQIVGQVTEPVYDTVTGQHLLIPQGTKIVGRYNADIGYGQDRLQIVWDRLIMPNGNSIGLEAMVGTDKAGAAGLEDQVDYHIPGLVGAVLLSSIIGAGASLATDSSADGSFVDDLGDAAAQQAASVGSDIVRRQLDIQPTITVRPGFRLNILAGRDVVLEPYR